MFVAVTSAEPDTIAGYYTLSASSIGRDELPAEYSRRLPRLPVPCAIIGRLAVSQAMQGRRLGTFLIMNAVERTLDLAGSIAINALIVDAIDDGAAEFYRRHGFVAFPTSQRRLYVPLATLRRLTK
jgi:GNAT superfamily N-acetyltransferase